jgi:hypothetical protein
MADRMLALRCRAAAPDAHGDLAAAGFQPAGAAYPGIANIGPDAPPYQPGGRQWTLSCDPALWPVAQQDMIVDARSGQAWIVLSADLRTHTTFPLVSYIDIQAHSYDGDGTKA